MGKWKSTQHPISDVRDWRKRKELEIQPDFQRRSVWSEQAKISLIDTIMKDIPMPKIFISQKIRDESTYRIVIDGQQRISAILDFIGNKFPLATPYIGDLRGKYFRDFDEDQKEEFLGYQLDFYEVSGYSESELREMYGRVNRYTIVLNKQELRRADFPGDYLTVSEKLSLNSYLDEARIFTPANRKRLGDVEYISELLAILIGGIQDKKESLDQFYIEYKEWEEQHFNEIMAKFQSAIDDIQLIFEENDFPLKATRFKQKSDFYSLFAAINELQNEGLSLRKDALPFLREDLGVLTQMIAPDADGLYGEYAVKCVSDANSSSSRIWRAEFLKKILLGAYKEKNNETERLTFLASLIIDDPLSACPVPHDNCVVCQEDVEQFQKGVVWCWPENMVFLSSMRLSHSACGKKEKSNFVWLEDD